MRGAHHISNHGGKRGTTIETETVIEMRITGDTRKETGKLGPMKDAIVAKAIMRGNLTITLNRAIGPLRGCRAHATPGNHLLARRAARASPKRSSLRGVAFFAIIR